MKFINYLEKISGVDILALTSFGIFFIFFYSDADMGDQDRQT